MSNQTATAQRSPGFRRYLETNATTTTFSALGANAVATAAGGIDKGDSILTAAELSGYAASGGAATSFKVFPISKCLNVQLIFFGVGDPAQTFAYRVYGVWRLCDHLGNLDAACSLVRPIGWGTATLGHARVPSTITAIPYIVQTSHTAGGTRWAHVVAWTAASESGTAPEGPLGTATTGWETRLGEGTSGAYSPTSDLIAGVLIPNLARCTGIFIDFDLTGATSCNALIMADEV